MNRFKDTMDDLRERSKHAHGSVPEPKVDVFEDAKQEKEPFFRLPYSSDPDPIDEPWKN